MPLGIFYQLMAVALTYCSIASNYTPDVLKGMREPPADQASEASAAPTTAETTKTSDPASIKSDTGSPIRQAPFLVLVVIAFFVSLALPFLAGVGNFIGWIIIAVGLWEAWRLNKRIPLDITGPFPAGAQPLPT